jgi:hypothetical protein
MLCAQVSYGIKVGVNVPKLNGDDVSDELENTIGFYAGGIVNIKLIKNISVQPELLWSNKGYHYEELGGTFKTSFNYIHVPILIQYNTTGFTLETGPQIGFLLTATQKGGIIGNQNLKEEFKSAAFSWGAGAGYQFGVGLGINVRYNIGLGSISNNSSIDARFNTLMIGITKKF